MGNGIGSSPLARGTRYPVHSQNWAERFIPAGAGNTGRSTSLAPTATVHPRWRGEHNEVTTLIRREGGSSPLARGTRCRVRRRHRAFRFIPAGAGNTLSFWASSSRMTGSSPLARGTRLHPPPHPARARFIPAGAGNTPKRSISMARWPVHPRWRGEHCPQCGATNGEAGSSPLARGTHHGKAHAIAVLRFIPAGAGNTSSCAMPATCMPVHPRWRGEHAIKAEAGVLEAGSSPLARGTQPQHHWLAQLGRFIPAGAGNTADRHRADPRFAVHPRWRGEHCSSLSSLRTGAGSSPLARGTRPARRLGQVPRRFIPAGAGNTSPS